MVVADADRSRRCVARVGDAADEGLGHEQLEPRQLEAVGEQLAAAALDQGILKQSVTGRRARQRSGRDSTWTSNLTGLSSPVTHRIVLSRDRTRIHHGDAVVGEADPAVVALEEQLRAAQLGADVTALDRLIADELLFTGPDGQLATKAQDLKSHRSGAVRLLMHEPEELRVRRVSEDVHVTALRARLEVRVGGSVVSGTYCYTRVWARERGEPRRVVAGHLSLIVDPG